MSSGPPDLELLFLLDVKVRLVFGPSRLPNFVYGPVQIPEQPRSIMDRDIFHVYI